MPTVNVYNIAKKKVGTVELDDAVFGAPVREHLFYAMVRYQRNKARSGNHSTKGPRAGLGGGKEAVAPEGHRRARQGSTRSPHWAGGRASCTGPFPRSHAHDCRRRRRALPGAGVCSRPRVARRALTIFDAFELEGIKTKGFLTVMKAFGIEDLLLVPPRGQRHVLASARTFRA
jgi:large subunit ribosomal protein L4